MRKIFLVLIFVFALMSKPVFAKNIKFVQITDVNYGSGENAQILENAISEINEMNDIDFVVFTGDNTASANETWLKGFVATAKKLNKPFYINVGEKDMSKTKYLPRETYVKKLHQMLGFKSPKSTNYTFKLKKTNVLFVVADGAKDFIILPSGYFPERTLNWIDTQINNNKDKKVVIIQHFPIANRTGNEFYYTANIPQYMQMLSKHENVIAMVSGHFNKNDEISKNGVYYIVTPSLTQKCYKIIEIDEENGYQVFTSLVRMD